MCMQLRLRRAQRAIAVLFFNLGFGYANWLARIPAVRERLGLNDQELGLVLLAPGVGALVAFAMTPALMRRYGTRAVGTVGATTYGVLMVLPAIAPSGPWAAAGLFAAGWFNGLMDVALNTQAVAVERARGKPILAALHGAFSLGSFAGAAAGGAAAALDWPVGLHLGGVGLASLAISWASGRALLNDPPSVPTVGGGFWPPRALLVLGAVALCSAVGEGAMAEWTGIYLHDVLHASMGAAASGYTAFSLAMVTGRLCGDAVVHRLAPKRALMACGLFAAAALGAGVCTDSPRGFIAACLGVGVGLCLVVPIVLRSATSLPRVPEATALSVVATLGYGGYLMGPPVLGLISHRFGMRVAMGTVVGALLLLAAFGARVRPSPAAPARAGAA